MMTPDLDEVKSFVLFLLDEDEEELEENPTYMEVKVTTDKACVFGFSVIGGASITIAAKGRVSLKKAIEKLDLAGKYIKKAENAYEQYKIDDEKYEEAGKAELRYKLKKQDLDWRKTGKTYRDALEEAFKRTGIDKSEFEVTKWAKDINGKSIPVEYSGPNGAMVDIDYAHYGVDSAGNWVSGPDAPHIGWQVGKKNKIVGHIIVDSVPAGR